MTTENAQQILDKLTPEQLRDLTFYRDHFPFRIVYGALHSRTGEFRCSAVFNMRQPNKLAREGWQVFTVSRGSDNG